jgi:hypothetical protein
MNINDITKVKLSEDGNTYNTNIGSVPKGHRFEAIIDKWIANGGIVEPYKTQAELEADAVIEAKQATEEALKGLTVTTTNGKVFDANLEARQNIADAILASSTLNLTSTTWRLADNSEVVVTLDELKEVQAMAVQAYASTKNIGAV